MDGPRTLAIDIGGSGLKAIVLTATGEAVSERTRRETPYPCTPPVLLDELGELVKTQPDHDRVSADQSWHILPRQRAFAGNGLSQHDRTVLDPRERRLGLKCPVW